MQLTVANITSVTGATIDETATVNIWIPAVQQEIQIRCNRTFTGDDAWVTPSSQSAWVHGEIPGGIVNGQNTIFTLAQTPDPTTLKVWRDGQLMQIEVDYTLTNKQIEFVEAPLAGSGVPLVADYLPQGSQDDESQTSEPEYPPDLGVAACWRTVLLAQDNPVATLTAQSEGDIKSETTGGLKVEYFENSKEKRQEIQEQWDKVLRRYRIPAICDSSPIPSTSLASGF